jgi:adenylate cyclase
MHHGHGAMSTGGDRTGFSSPAHAPPPSDHASVASRKSISLSGPLTPMTFRLPAPNAHLGPSIRENMTEDELIEVLASLTTRIENSLSTLYFKHLGGFTTALAALEHATRIDPQLILHALSLMDGAMTAQL